MANKVIQTRIKNRFDELTNWQAAGVELLPGEIALVKVPTGATYTNPVTGKSEPVIELLMKVGENGSDGNPKAFSALPWLSAKAADVYAWAKTQHAADVTVSVGTGESAKSTTLGNLFEAVSSNDADIAAINEALEELIGSDSGSIADRITAAIEALDHSGDAVANQIVKTVTQTDGKVTVTYGSITEDELPNISTSKIKVDDTTTLDTKLDDLDSAIAAIPGNFSVENTGSGVVKSISYDDAGKFTATRSTVNTTDITDAAVTTGKIADSNVTTAKIADNNVTDAKIVTVSAAKVEITAKNGDTDAVMLPAKLDDLDSEISNIKDAIAGGVHFRGTTTTALSDGSTTQTIVIGGSNYTASNGDVVIYKANAATAEDEEKEFIWVQPEGATSGHWEVLGDLSRVGALETALDNLDYDGGAFGNHKFVTKVTQENGLVAAEYAQPTAADISYTTSSNTASTVDAELDDHASRLSDVEDKLDGVTDKVTISISEAINALDVAEPTASGTSTSFIATAKQEDGKIVVTKKNLPEATTDTKGIVQLSSDVGSTSETLAATPKAVKVAYDAGTDAQSRVAAVEGDYVRFKDNQLYVGKEGTDAIIFDCGGAQ